jgi:hypothetical protein
LILAKLALALVPSIIFFGTSLVVKSIYQQFTYSDSKSTCKIVYEAVAEYHNKHNKEDKIKLYTCYQENLKRFADKTGLPKPKPRGPWKFKSGRLYRR